jgi:ribose transport system substrate-binding protein
MLGVSGRTTRPRVARAVAAAVAAALAVGAATACGDSDESSSEGGSSASAATQPAESAASDGVAKAAEAVAKHRAASDEFVAPGPEVDASSLRGRTVWFVPLAATIPTFGADATGIRDAAKKLGITVKTCDGKFTPANAAACITQATNGGADGIITNSIDPAAVGTSLSAAIGKKIPVVQMYGTKGETGPYSQFVSVNDLLAHSLAADWIIADSEGKAKILMTTVQGDASATNAAVNGGKKRFQENCPDCTVVNVNSTATTVDQIPSSVSATLLKNPEVDYGFPSFDFLVPGFQRGVQQAGKSGRIKIVSSSQDTASMNRVKNGQQAADAGTNRNYGGWLAMDAYVRMALGEKPQTSDHIPARVFDKTNIDSVEITDAAFKSGAWYGSTAYTGEFAKLWGVE